MAVRADLAAERREYNDGLKKSSLIFVGPKSVMAFTAKKYNSSSKALNIDPTAPITSNIPPREASREPQHLAKRANMEKDMP